ncbi:hypothetical protein Barb7_01137 [Bacteroidales bacterium Barb7]|nr:hypothetical protein Barb7_01137 [Bacteroidales bacterium Barb7]
MYHVLKRINLKEIYPQSIPMLKNAFFVNFLGLSQKHAEKKLQRSILENMKEFALEYAMSRSRSPTMIAEYQRQLISKEALQQEFTQFLNQKK